MLERGKNARFGPSKKNCFVELKERAAYSCEEWKVKSGTWILYGKTGTPAIIPANRWQSNMNAHLGSRELVPLYLVLSSRIHACMQIIYSCSPCAILTVIILHSLHSLCCSIIVNLYTCIILHVHSLSIVNRLVLLKAHACMHVCITFLYETYSNNSELHACMLMQV